MTESVSITWWGHATVTLELAGTRIVTDPVLTSRVAHLSRIGGAVPGGAALDADAAVVSHLHPDHLDIASLRMFSPSMRIVAPHGAVGALHRSAPDLARRLEEVGAGDVIDLGGVRVAAVPAAHDGRRHRLSRHRGPALGYVLETSTAGRPLRVWFAGDTGLFAAMVEIGPVDVALVPVGGWGPTLGPTHLDPARAVEAVRLVGARDAVPIHYGTFWPTGLRRLHPASFRRCFAGPGMSFAELLGAAGPDLRAHVVGLGRTVEIGIEPHV